MAQKILRDLPADIVFPLTRVRLYGEAVPAPAQPQAFLEARFGADWRVPDRFAGLYWMGT